MYFQFKNVSSQFTKTNIAQTKYPWQAKIRPMDHQLATPGLQFIYLPPFACELQDPRTW